MSPAKFAKLVGLKVVARTDTEDDLLREASNSDNSLSISDTLHSTSNDYPVLVDSFFSPPDYLNVSCETLPRKSVPPMPSKSHLRSRSDGGACFMIPVGNTKEVTKGRFTLRREEVESSYWRPRRITGPSRFQENDLVND
jgi:hypothetical protein